MPHLENLDDTLWGAVVEYACGSLLVGLIIFGLIAA